MPADTSPRSLIVFPFNLFPNLTTLAVVADNQCTCCRDSSYILSSVRPDLFFCLFSFIRGTCVRFLFAGCDDYCHGFQSLLLVPPFLDPCLPFIAVIAVCAWWSSCCRRHLLPFSTWLLMLLQDLHLLLF